MATTGVAALLECDASGIRQPVRGATIAHVGDSRVYRWRRGVLDRLTRDHSWVEEQILAGLITAREARRHPRRNLLTRALTGGADPLADLAWVPFAQGDRLLLCSDGLPAALTDEQIAEILTKYDAGAGSADPVAGVCDALVHAANLAGGPDNITAILIRP
jgi:protein phosphatase